MLELQNDKYELYENIDSNKIYMVRLYTRFLDKYVYKIGSTTNIR